MTPNMTLNLNPKAARTSEDYSTYSVSLEHCNRTLAVLLGKTELYCLPCHFQAKMLQEKFLGIGQRPSQTPARQLTSF